MSLHVSYSLDIEELPRECIQDCSSSGDVSEVVTDWRKKLGFTVDRDKAIQCLEGYGAWEREEMEKETNETIAERILWLASGNFREFLVWKERNPEKTDENAGCGSTVFVLE